MRKLLRFCCPLHKVKWVDHLLYSFRYGLFVFLIIITTRSFAQTFPPASSCTSGDLSLVSATMPPNAGDDACGTCTAGSIISRRLILTINNKTGSTRTSFAFWGTLELYNSSGTLVSSRQITRCKGPIPKNAITPVDFDTIQYGCGQSLRLTNLYLAWTTSNTNETCPLNSATINPKCGILPAVQIVAGLDANFVVTNASCTAGGSIAVSPFGGNAPYSVTINGTTHSNIAAGATTTFSLSAGTYSITITDATSPTACTTIKSRTVGSSSAPTVNAGTAFTKTCTSNASGAVIGEPNDVTATYSWSPSSGLSSATVSNPTANPASTTTYTVTKTTIANGCSAQASVVVTVNTTNPSVTNIGGAFTKTCTLNTSGGTIGESNDATATYSWSPSSGLSSTTVSNPTANPAATTTYTVTKTTTANGCSAQASVAVTVNTTNPSVTNIGGAFTKTCTLNTSGAVIGESNDATATYSWSPSGGLSSATVSNPTANPAATTTYTVTKTTTANGCTAQANVTVTVNVVTPGAPTFCVVQPSLCGPTTGSVTILSPTGTGYQYSINNGGDWQTGTAFNNLIPGSVTGIKVKDISSGCTSDPILCDASNCTPQARLSSANSSDNVIKSQITSVMLGFKSPINDNTEKLLTVKAYPNPFNDKVRFDVTSSVAGNGSLDVYNMLGQKIKTIYQGFISGSKSFELSLPAKQISNLVYVLRIGNKKITGKLLQINQ